MSGQKEALSAPTHTPPILTSKGSTSTEVLKSLSSGCSMLPLRKKNLQTPSRPMSCGKNVPPRPTVQAQEREGQAWARNILDGYPGAGRG